MIYKIRVILDSEEDIFRDLGIEEHATLEDLHNTVTQSFGFLGNEMASFYTCDEQWNQDEEIALFDMGRSEVRLMGETGMTDVLTEESPKLIYVYDYLSMWTFFVEQADIVPKEDGRNYQNLLLNFIQCLNVMYLLIACSNIEHHVHECQHVCTCSMSVDLLFIMLSSIRQDLLIGSIFNLVWTSSAFSNNTCIYK